MANDLKKQSWQLKAILSLLILFIFALVIEAALHLIDLDLYQKNQFFPTNRDIDFVEFYEKDQNLFWRFRPSKTIDSKRFSAVSYQINNYGMRGDDVEKKSDKTRIVALGNSCTFGWGVRQDKIWTSKLETFLNKNSVSYDVLNTGVPGYSSHQGKYCFENELLEFNPSVVLIMYGWNDQRPAGKDISDAEQQMPGKIILGMQNIFSKMKTYQFFRKLILSSTEKQDIPRIDQLSGKKRVSTKEFADNLKVIIRTAKRNKITPILIVPPVASMGIYFPEQVSYFHQLHKRYQDIIINSAGYEQVPLVNLQIEFDKYNDLFDDANDDPIHFNAKGHGVAADAIQKKILELSY